MKQSNTKNGMQVHEVRNQAMDSARALFQLAFDNTQSITHINFEIIEAAIERSQQKALKMMNNDKHIFVEYFQDEPATATLTQMMAFQAKLAEVLRKNNQVFMLMANEAMDKTQSEFRKLAHEAMSKAPSGSEAFASAFSEAFDAGMQKLHEDRLAKQTAFDNLQKIIDVTFSATEAQLAAQKRPSKVSGNGVAMDQHVHA
jgi:hypothetical protein